MKKILCFILIFVISLGLFIVPVSAESDSDSIYNVRPFLASNDIDVTYFNHDTISAHYQSETTGTKYDYYFVCTYSDYYYVILFNESAVQNPSASLYVSPTIRYAWSSTDGEYYRFDTQSAAFLFACYSNYVDFNTLGLHSNYGSPLGEYLTFRKDQFILTNCDVLKTAIEALGYSVMDEYYYFYNNNPNTLKYAIFDAMYDGVTYHAVNITSTTSGYESYVSPYEEYGTYKVDKGYIYTLYFTSITSLYNFMFSKGDVNVNAAPDIQAITMKKSITIRSPVTYCNFDMFDSDGAVYKIKTEYGAELDGAGVDANDYIPVVSEICEFLFVPDAKFIETRLPELIGKWSFGPDLMWFADRVKDVFNQDGQSPPVIKVDLSAAEGKIKFTDKTGEAAKVNMLDFSWYGRYKPAVDKVLSAFMWLGFLWAVYRNLPALMSGMTVSVMTDTFDKTAGKVERENEKRERREYRELAKKEREIIAWNKDIDKFEKLKHSGQLAKERAAKNKAKGGK